MPIKEITTNNLEHSLSPYLRQHKENPVFWQEWSNDIIDYARKHKQPILLSIGYSTCHWCHVMAHESFEDNETAQLMNTQFINIKIDREERPDLDKIYQQAHLLLNQRSGGWPLTIFLEPDSLSPFFVGTYFPKEPRESLPSFKQLLVTLSSIYHEKPEDIFAISHKIQQQLLELNQVSSESNQKEDLSPLFVDQCLVHGDKEWGGLSGAPKFPQPILLRTALKLLATQKPDNQEALHQFIQLTAQAMSRIGLFDHLAGGFFRYCVDNYWGIPHFEKMLYDNALLLTFYNDLARFTMDGHYADLCRKTCQWLMKDMMSEEGGFYSALDADSEGKEGQYYIWKKEQIKQQLDDDEWAIAEIAFGLSQAPNFEECWHLHQWYFGETLAKKANKPLKQVNWMLESIKEKLLSLREQRIRPHRDEKILTSWNALLISALFQSSQILKNPDIEKTAWQTLYFIKEHLWKEQKLLSVHSRGISYQEGFLDDYAFLSQAILDALQIEWRQELYDWLLKLAEVLVEQFYNNEGGFFFSSHDNSPDKKSYLLTKTLCLNDDALPNGNAVTLSVFNLMGTLSGTSHYSDIIEKTLQISANDLNQYILSHAALLNTYLEYKHGIQCIVLRGSLTEILKWKDTFGLDYRPHQKVFLIPNHIELSKNLEEKYPTKKETYATICDQQGCSLPITSLSELQERLTNLSLNS